MQSHKLLVCTVTVSDALAVGACWIGGPTIGVHIEHGGTILRATSWPIWNEAWDTPLISVSRESFERFVVGRLNEPGVVDELVGLATVR